MKSSGAGNGGKKMKLKEESLSKTDVLLVKAFYNYFLIFNKHLSSYTFLFPTFCYYPPSHNLN